MRSAPLGVRVERVSSKKDLEEFIRFPIDLFSDSPFYVPHLIVERREFFNPRKNPFFEHADAVFLLARDEAGRVVGRMTAHVDWNFVRFHGEKTGFFGFFDAVDDPGVARLLFEAGESFLREKGMTRVIGPMNFNTNGEVGVLVRGFEGIPFFMMPYNFPYYSTLLESCGYVKEKDLYAYYTTYPGYTPEILRKISDKARRGGQVTVRPVDMRNFRRELEMVKAVYNSAWERNWGFVPMTDAELEYMAKNLKPLIDPEMALFAFVRDEPAGFFLSLPDYNLIIKDLKGSLFPTGIFR
ncbi:MAG: N-acetyltransferase, partial [Deltaproteobacteria bacterium]